MRALSFSVLALSLAACGNDSGGGGGAPGPGPGTDAGDGGIVINTEASTTGPCATPTGATVLVDYRSFVVNPADSTQDSVVRNIVPSTSELYVSFLDSVVKLPLSGGEPTRIYTATDTMGLTMYGLDGGRIIIRDGQNIVDASSAPVAYPQATHPVNGLNAASGSLFAPNGDRYLRYDDRDDSFAPTVTHFVRLRQGAASQEVVARAATVGWGRNFVFGAGALWTNQSQVSGGQLPSPDSPARVGTDGAVSTVTVDKPGPVFLVTANFIYYDRSSDAPLGELGVWRAPIAGGAGEKLGGSFGGWSGVADGRGKVILANASSLHVIDDTAGATLRQIASLPVRSTIDTSCTSHGLATTGSAVISSMFDKARNSAQIFQYSY